MKQLLLMGFLTVTAVTCAAQNTLNNLALGNANPAAGAYSLRLLSSSYTGSAIQVRRSSDNATQDIGFTTGGDLDTNALKAFTGANNGFVATWYDQSGFARNAVQLTNGNQPAIVSAGAVNRVNSQPAIGFTATASQFLVVTATAFNDDLSGTVCFNAGSANTQSGSAGAWYNMNGIFGSEQGGDVTDFAYGVYNNKFTAGFGTTDNSVGGNTVVNNGISRVHSWTRNNATGAVNLFANGTADGSQLLGAGTRSSVPSVAIGANQIAGAQYFLTGSISELVLFAAVNTNITRQTVEMNQGNYYGVSIAVNITISRNGKFVTDTTQFVDRNGKKGGAGILRSGETYINGSFAAPVTTAISNIASAAATSGGNISFDGGANLTAGVCWNTGGTPTTADSKTMDAGAAGPYTSSLGSLTGNTTYFVRAYATRGATTLYGNEISFTTLAPVPPVLAATTAAGAIISTGASSGGNIISDGGAAVTARGVCWSTSPNPTTADAFSSNGTGPGIFSSTITGLGIGITYYVRSYATNSAGTAYGSAISFTTALGIGETYLGGKIACFFVSGDPGYVAGESHGLIISSANISTLSRWYVTTFMVTGATATGLGTGDANTSTIISMQGNTGTYAAKLCRDYRGGSYTDWYLPSKDELNKLFLNRVAIGGLSATYHWSSTETASTTAWRQTFSTGLQVSSAKSTSAYVRAVRKF